MSRSPAPAAAKKTSSRRTPARQSPIRKAGALLKDQGRPAALAEAAVRAASSAKRSWLSGAVRREEILKSAIGVFATKSYQGTTVRDIAQAAGVSEALLYKYFPSKKALFLEAFERSNRFLFGRLHEILRASRRPNDVLRDLFVFYYRFLSEESVYPRMLFLAMAELDDPDFRRVVVGGLKRSARTLQKGLQKAQELGLFRRDVSIEAVSWLVLGGYQMLALMKEAGILQNMEPQSLGRLIDPLLGNFVRGAGEGG
ncbi:MAG: TetR/AcrR family transcriptional regulator [Bdellovibrionota bacterium]